TAPAGRWGHALSSISSESMSTFTPPRLSTTSSAKSGWRRPNGCSGCRGRAGSAARPATASSTTSRAQEGPAENSLCRRAALLAHQLRSVYAVAPISTDMDAPCVLPRERASHPDDERFRQTLLAFKARGAALALGHREPVEHGLAGEPPVAPELAAGQLAFRGERPDSLLVDLQQLGELLDREHVWPAEL